MLLVLGALSPVTANAQTATPHPDALAAGLYQFENLSSPQIELTGIDWTICNLTTSGDVQRSLCDDDSGDTMEFYVTNTDYILLQAIFNSAGSSADDISITIDATPYWSGLLRNPGSSGGSFDFVTIDPDDTNAQITITRNTNQAGRYDFMILQPPPIDLSSISGTGGTSPTIPTATPIAYAIYGTISGVSGTVPTRFDYYVSAGDVGISVALLFLLFSIWSILIIYFVVVRDVRQ